jgi:hypothetical protein
VVGGGVGGRSERSTSRNFDKEFWEDKECYKCEKKGHPAHSCPKGQKGNSSKDDDKSVRSTANSVKKLKEEIRGMKKGYKKAFITVNAQLEKLEEAAGESDLSESGSEADFFQCQFAQVKFEPTIVKLFKQAQSTVKIDLREVILLDSQSTMDLFCNEALVTKT